MPTSIVRVFVYQTYRIRYNTRFGVFQALYVVIRSLLAGDKTTFFISGVLRKKARPSKKKRHNCSQYYCTEKRKTGTINDCCLSFVDIQPRNFESVRHKRFVCEWKIPRPIASHGRRCGGPIYAVAHARRIFRTYPLTICAVPYEFS